MTQTKLDIPALIQQFNENGYLILPGVLSEDKVNRLNAAIDRIVSEEPESLAYNIYNSIERDDEIASLIDEPTLLPLMVNLLGYNIQLHISHLTIRKPNPNDVKTESHSFINWHQDGPHPQFPKQNGITSTYYIKTCYILSDMTQPDRGNTKIIPGSHNKVFHPESQDVQGQVAGEVQVCGKPGDVFIFPQNLWHAGAPNRSEFTRRQLFLGYSPIWLRPIDYRTASDRLLENASPYRNQLLGVIDENPFKYYVPSESMVPLKELYNQDAGNSVYK
ncbi:phytanoyl-CoA dioxygenase family protein [Paenibacillus aceris]|uniref:Ectoine hydroxylase-related dioxygenase (Phytanoyl-CoA dioxygenase family) n=1 Tax=Paenibacillus aceris TaxID=869555 RepID=A0ABS4I5W4_9BACL|nr:phytanoyl-CoA dioxygenase family protein [Paenibacillus aceris]MBP1966218.1 ectoine hydroxylase-related dioxygenase (phytanoyl-CoA dioxygenase family) [Paenibacillus aceris]NHW33371.1 phytanoyl-CoA dioxygenase family protein [Paenibacillus aceris]